MNFEDYVNQRKQQLGVVDPESPSPTADNGFESYVQSRQMKLGLTQPNAAPLSEQQNHALEIEQSEQAQMAEASRISDEMMRPQRQLDQDLLDRQQMDQASRLSESMAPKQKPFLAKIQSDIYDNTIGPVADKFMRAAVSSVDSLFPGDQREQMKQAPEYQRQIFGQALEPAQTWGDEAADMAGSLYGATPGILGAYKVGGKLLNKVTSKLPNLTNKLSSTVDDIGRLNGIGNASKYAGMAARGAIAGPLHGSVREGLEIAQGEEQSISGRLGDIAMDAVLFGTGDALFGVAGKGIQALKGTKFGDAVTKFFSREPAVVQEADAPIADMLALPTGKRDVRLAAANERSNLPYGEDIIAPASGIPENALPQGNYTQPQRLKVETNADPYINTVMERIKPIVNERMTPPLENPNELAKWVHQRMGIDDLSLNEVRTLPYEDLRVLAEEMRSRLSVKDEAYQAAREQGYDLEKLFAGETPKLSNKIAQDASQRAYGVNPELPNIQKPAGFNSSVTGSAAAPLERLQYRPGEMKVPSNKSVRQAAQSLGGGMKQRPVNVSASVEPPVNRLSAAMDATVKPVQPSVRLPRGTEIPQQPRGFAETLKESDKTPQGFKDKLKSAYTPITNETSVKQANKRVDKDIEAAASYVIGRSQLNAEKVTTAHRVIDELSKSGNYERANDVADSIAKELTKAGQSIQAASIYNRLTPEGILVHAKRIEQRVNQDLSIISKESRVTPEMSERIIDLARTTQKMQGAKELANEVQNILDRAKSGEKLTEIEATTLKNFVNESKQFIKETTRPPKAPRPPQEPKDTRVKDNVVKFIDAQEQAARDRIKARGTRLSSTPLDLYADYAIIGAAKMGKGTIKFGEWSAAMVKDFGEEIRPQLQHLYERSVQAYNQSSKVVTKQTISEAEKITERVIKTKDLDAPMVDTLRSLAQKVSGLSGDAKITASQDLQQILQTLERPGILKKVSSAQTIGQLLNPKTQVRNIVGNELFYRVERLMKYATTPIDIARSKIFGGDRTVTFKTNNQGEFWKNWMRGGKAGYDRVNINGLQTVYDLGSPAFTSKYNPLTYMEKALGASLRSFDTAAYMRAYNNTVGEMATLRAINEGKKGDKELIQKYIREADDNVMKIADEYGKYVTFQDNNAISKGMVATKRALNLGKDFGIGDLVLKYPKTPGALLMRALEYSPAGLIRSLSIASRPFFKKEPNTREATEALTRAMMGTFGFSGLGYFLMDKGIVTGTASKDKDVRELQKEAGQGQYQVNLSALSRFVKSGFDPESTKLKQDDYMYTYDWMQPISIAASMGANIAKNVKEGKSKLEGLAGTAYNSIEGGLSTLTEQSVLSGLKSATQISPGQSVADKLIDILTDIPSTFVPTYVNQIKQLTDNTKPETFSQDKLERGLNKAQAKIPGLADKLPKQFSGLGDKKEVYQDNSAFNVLLNPGFSSNYKLSPEAKYIVDLMNESNDESVAPRVPGKTISVNGQSMQLNGDQFSRLQELQGLAQKKEIGKLKGTGSLKNRVDRDQAALTKAGTDARKQLVKEFPELKPVKAK